MEEEDPLLSSRRQPFSSQVNLRRAESAEEVVQFDYGVDDQSTDETHIRDRVRGMTRAKTQMYLLNRSKSSCIKYPISLALVE